MSVQSDRNSYGAVRAQLEDITERIRSKDTSLDQCLDLYEEAITLGNSCAELIDTADFSVEELKAAQGDAEDGSDTSESQETADDVPGVDGAGRADEDAVATEEAGKRA